MGLGMQNQMFNPMGGYSGITSFVANQMASMLANGGNGIPTKYDKDGNATEFCNDFKDGTLYSRMMQDYYGGGFQAVYDENNKSQITGYKSRGGTEYTVDQYNLFTQAMTTAQSQQSQAQFMAQQMASQYESNVSVWTEAYKAQLEEEQNAALLPLEAEETDIDLDMSSCETQLADARARLDSIKQACSEEIKNSAPTFGLG